jgi:hypothetical protein
MRKRITRVVRQPPASEPDDAEYQDDLDDESDYEDEEPGPAAAKKKAPTWFVVLFVVVVLAICGAIKLNGSSGSKPDDLGAQTVCETFVKDQLKAPATADFSGARVSSDGTTWTVRGAVDAENSFGAKLRYAYVCTVSPADPAGNNWHLLSLTGLS